MLREMPFEARRHTDCPYTNTDWRPVAFRSRAPTFGETLRDGFHKTVWLYPKALQIKEGRAYKKEGRLFLKLANGHTYEMRPVESPDDE